MTGLFHKIVQKWKYPVLKKQKYPTCSWVRGRCVHPLYTVYQSMKEAVGGMCSEPPAANQGNMFCKCFLITNTICLIGGLCLASAGSGFAVTAASETYSEAKKLLIWALSLKTD